MKGHFTERLSRWSVGQCRGKCCRAWAYRSTQKRRWRKDREND